MPKAERDRVIAEYQSAVQAYSDAVRRLIGLVGRDFEAAYKEAERLRQASEQHRAALERSSE